MNSERGRPACALVKMCLFKAYEVGCMLVCASAEAPTVGAAAAATTDPADPPAGTDKEGGAREDMGGANMGGIMPGIMCGRGMPMGKPGGIIPAMPWDIMWGGGIPIGKPGCIPCIGDIPANPWGPGKFGNWPGKAPGGSGGPLPGYILDTATNESGIMPKQITCRKCQLETRKCEL